MADYSEMSLKSESVSSDDVEFLIVLGSKSELSSGDYNFLLKGLRSLVLILSIFRLGTSTVLANRLLNPFYNSILILFADMPGLLFPCFNGGSFSSSESSDSSSSELILSISDRLLALILLAKVLRTLFEL